MTLYSSPEASSVDHSLSASAMEAAVGILAHLETEQLEKINEDETELINIINDSEIVKSLQSEREEIVTSNKSLAEFNVSLEPTLKEKKELLRELYITQGEIFASFDGKKQTLEKNTGATSLDTILAILQSEAATSDEASEELAESFLSNSLPVEQFLGDFRLKRKVTHMQRIKSEKFGEMIANGYDPNGSELTAEQPAQPPSQQQSLQQPQNNFSSNWNSSPSAAHGSSHLPSPSRIAAAPPSIPYPQPTPSYPMYNPGQAAAPQHGPYWSPPHTGVQTGPPPGSNMPYPLSQPPPQTQQGGPRGGWGQGRAPYQMPYMAMPQPHMPGYR